MSKETLEIIRGLSQAAANAYDGAHMENYSHDGQARKAGLKREDGFENEIVRTLNEVKKFLQKEYKTITGKSISLKAKGEPQILVQTTSRIRTFVQAYQHYKIGGLKLDPMLEPSEPSVRDVTRKFLETAKAKRPQNEKIKASDNQKK